MDNPNITMEEYIRLEEEKAHRRGKVYRWETAMYGKIWYDKDVHDHGFVEIEFPAIVFNDALTSKVTLSCEPTVSPLNDHKIDFKASFDESDDEDYTVIYDENSFSNKIIAVNNLKTDYENDNDKVNMTSFPSPEPEVNNNNKIDIERPSRDMSVTPIPEGSNKLSETSHDTSNKFFNTETFIKKLNVNIMACNHLNNGMLLNLIKNLYVSFGIPFDPKLFYKDGSKLGQVELND
ncbi:hypothetical protein Tco_1201586 [Tanacetum coccineum]